MVNILYITGESHSGSTLLTLLLGAHDRVFAAGEVKAFSHKAIHNYIRKSRPDLLDANLHEQAEVIFNRPCTCGTSQIRACPVWQAIDIYIQANYSRTLQDINVDLVDYNTFVRDTRILFEAIQVVRGADWIVDSSKSLARLISLRTIPEFNIVTVHLVRNPLGVVYSEYKRKRPWLATAYIYFRHEWQRRRMLPGVPHIVLTYEELVRQPEAALRRCMDAMGLAYQSQQLRWTEQQHHLFQGNRMRYTKESTIQEDTQWHSGLNLLQKLTIALMMLPLRLNLPRLFRS